MPQVKKRKKRSESAVSDRWDLSPLFKNEDEWEALFKNVDDEKRRITRYKGKLGDSVSLFKEAIDCNLSVSRDLEKLYVYAHLRVDEDTMNQKNRARIERVLFLYNEAGELASFLTPEMQSLPDETIEAYMRDPSLADYRFMLEKTFRYKPHTLSEREEALLAQTARIADAPSDFFSQLDNADMTFGVIENDNGEQEELTHGNFSSFLQSPNRAVREAAFNRYYASYEAHKHAISTAYAASVKKDYFYMKARKFSSCREKALFADNVPLRVYDTLIDTVKKHLSPLFDYLALKAKMVGVPKMRAFDLYAPIVPDVDFHMPYEEAVAVCVSALAPLGEDYCAVMKEGLLHGWVDRYENEGKRSGAYSSGCYDSPPYILLNYTEDNLNSVYTMIHEAGHSMHSYYSRNAQPYMYGDYTIFVAEVASTFNETLLSAHLQNYYRNDAKMQAYIVHREIENIRATLIRQTMFAEFEAITHENVENNIPLTFESMTAIYKRLLEEYFSDALEIDEALTREYLRIPHFYNAFYVYKYATGISAALALAKRVLQGDENAARDYRAFLSLGGSMFPIEALTRADVDMAAPKPIEEAMAHFKTLVTTLSEYSKNGIIVTKEERGI